MSWGANSIRKHTQIEANKLPVEQSATQSGYWQDLDSLGQ